MKSRMEKLLKSDGYAYSLCKALTTMEDYFIVSYLLKLSLTNQDIDDNFKVRDLILFIKNLTSYDYQIITSDVKPESTDTTIAKIGDKYFNIVNNDFVFLGDVIKKTDKKTVDKPTYITFINK